MTKAEQFHMNFQYRLNQLGAKEELTVAETYELHILKLLDGEYDDEADMENMGIAFDKLVNHIFLPYMPSYADNT